MTRREMHQNLEQSAATTAQREHGMRDGKWRHMQRRSTEWSYLCKLVSRQGGEEGGWGKHQEKLR